MAHQSMAFDSSFFEEIFENSSSIALITDEKGIIMRANRRAVEMFTGCALDAGSMEGKDVMDFVHEEDRHKVLNLWRTGVSENRETSFELRMCSLDGKVMYFLVSGRPIVRDGRAALFHFQALNMLDLKVQEQELMSSAGADVIAQIAGGFAHDLNNLLTVINGYAQMAKFLLDETSPLTHKVNQILEAGRKASELTQRMLDFGRRKSSAPPKFTEVSSELSNQEAIIHHIAGDRVKVSLVRSPDLGRIAMEPSRFATILANLVVNARDAMPEGGEIVISAQPFSAENALRVGDDTVQAGSYIRISVKDTGLGMDENVLLRACEPFFSTKEQGKGIGLWTVKNMVKASGGYMHIASLPRQGTEVTVLLPLATEHASAAKETVEAGPSQTPLPTTGAKTVLIVEDDDTVRDLVNEVLTRNGFKTLVARNGGDALQMARQYNESIDLLITDMVMRRIDGKMLARKMKSIQPGIRIMFMSGYGREIADDPEFTGSVFLQKPFLPQDLLELANKALAT